MKVRLLKDIVEDGRLKASIRPGRPTIPYIAGAVIECSDATSSKWIATGIAESIKEEEKENA